MCVSKLTFILVLIFYLRYSWIIQKKISLANYKNKKTKRFVIIKPTIALSNCACSIVKSGLKTFFNKINMRAGRKINITWTNDDGSRLHVYVFPPGWSWRDPSNNPAASLVKYTSDVALSNSLMYNRYCGTIVLRDDDASFLI